MHVGRAGPARVVLLVAAPAMLLLCRRRQRRRVRRSLHSCKPILKTTGLGCQAAFIEAGQA